MNVGLFAFLSMAIFFLSSESSFAFRCGNELVTRGDSKSHVEAKCGRPHYAETANQKVEGRFDASTVRHGRYSSTTGGYEETLIVTEHWFYDCGPNDFIYKLTFTDNVLIKEDSVGRGKAGKKCLSSEERSHEMISERRTVTTDHGPVHKRQPLIPARRVDTQPNIKPTEQTNDHQKRHRCYTGSDGETICTNY